MAEKLLRYRAVLFSLFVVLVLGGLVVLQLRERRTELSPLDRLTPAPSPEPTATPRPIRVYVTGAVAQPDVYYLQAGSIVKDAVVAAGGATVDADLERINLAFPLSDGQQIHVPRQDEENLPVELPSRLSQGGKVNINTADAALLETLPGIGPTRAQQIVGYRTTHGPFDTVEELVEVPGIGPATLEKLRDLVVTR